MKNTNELGQGVGNSNITSSVPKEYTNLVWSEEFDGDSLDTGMWQCRGSYYSKQLDCHCGEEYIRYDLSDNYDGLSDMSGFQNPAYILLSLAVYTRGKHDGGGREPIDSDFPCEFVIDYLRLYQNPNQENNLCEITP